jgi:rhodanese-related sulfurtransferase
MRTLEPHDGTPETEHRGAGPHPARGIRRLLWLLLCALPLPFLVSCTRRTASDAATAGDSTAESRHGPWPAQLEELVVQAREKFQAPTLRVEDLEAHREDYLLVDVRPAAEQQVSAIPGALPLDTEARRSEFLVTRPERPVVVYCTAGWRSAEFTSVLDEAGFIAYNLEGGICAWAAAGQPIVDPAGEPTRKIHSFNADFAGCVPHGYQAISD